MDEPIEDLEGEVEVYVRAADNAPLRGLDLFEVVAALPIGQREKADIDADLARERDSWNGRL